MIRTTMDQETTLSSLAGLYRLFTENKDTENSAKIKQLIEKTEAKEVQLAFCGHFSAGKSTMINHLVGKKILPSSPIPTSANVVKVKSGKEAIKVFFFDGTYMVFEGAHDMKEIKAFCKEGDIKEIHIMSEHFPLADDCAVIDTPGIDSTDDAHRISTQSTLHLADIIVYVMDYNHVQSQENFLFARKMAEMGKRLYLIVNMIDKHDSAELAFSDFKQSVSQAFSQWNIEPEGIFYTSLRDFSMPENQIKQVQQFIQERIEYERNHLLESIREASIQLAEDHAALMEERHQKKTEEAEEVLAGLTEEERHTVPDTLSELNVQIKEIASRPERAYLEDINELKELLKNVYLLTAESRDMIQAFLESQQPGFKVGMFFSKNKTEAEKQARESRLMEELEQRTKTQLEWHVRELASKHVKKAGILSSPLETEAQKLSVSFSMEEIKGLISQQSNISGDYLLLFSEKVANLIKKKAKEQMLSFYEGLKEEMAGLAKEKSVSIQAKADQWSRYNEALAVIEFARSARKQALASAQELIQGKATIQPETKEAILLQIRTENEKNGRKADLTSLISKAEENHNQMDNVQLEPANAAAGGTGSREALEHWSGALAESAEKIRDVQGFASIIKEMKDKAKRMQDQTFTIALFGAFSAGKSSFANALLSEKILPVSPNPTTAVINKIQATDEKHGHKTAKIKMKSERMLFEDVRLACETLGFHPGDLQAAFEFSGDLSKVQVQGDGKERAHLSFLAAFREGYPQLQSKLGQILHADYEEYAEYAAKESKSCFVEEIVLHFDCELTKQGIVLVDTPGADSINARHTNAAFHYIKNSDAILFVTYYNHPFAKADREFLIQLGRVKDAFSIDKMFFICNAIDLAQDEEEMDDVIRYINSQLEGFGIRFPKLYPLSSKEALRELTGDYSMSHPFLKDSGMGAFKEAFARFISEELVGLASASAKLTVERAANQLRDLIEAAASSMEEKQGRMRVLERNLSEIKDSINRQTFTIESEKLGKEMEELLYYIKQRVFLRFNDFFKESFNPSIIKGDASEMKAGLQRALKELIASIGFDLEQEMRATGIRLERYTVSLIKAKEERYQQLIANIWPTASIPEYSAADFDTPDVGKAFEMVKEQDFKKELSTFKNAKSFFEKNEKKKMAELLEVKLQEPADGYLTSAGTDMKEHYSFILEKEMTDLQSFMIRAVEDLFESYSSVLSANIDIDSYKEKEEALRKWLI